jgi:uncharacterized membrane protein
MKDRRREDRCAHRLQTLPDAGSYFWIIRAFIKPTHQTNPLHPGEHSDTLPLVSYKGGSVAFCPTCGTQIADGATCPKCAAGTGQNVTAVTTSAPGLSDNVAGALAYLTIIPAIVFLVLEPFNKRAFVRFHAFQSIFYCVAWIAVDIGLAIIGHIPFLGWAILFLWPLVTLVLFVILLVLALKAYQGQKFKLPVIGDIAAQQAGA